MILDCRTRLSSSGEGADAFNFFHYMACLLLASLLAILHPVLLPLFPSGSFLHAAYKYPAFLPSFPTWPHVRIHVFDEITYARFFFTFSLNNERSSVFSALGSTSYIPTNLCSFIVASTCVNASLLRFATVTFFLPNTYFCIPEGNFNECVVINLATLNLSKIEENYLPSITNSCVSEKSNTTFRPQPFNNT